MQKLKSDKWRLMPDIKYRMCEKKDFLKIHEINKERFDDRPTSLITLKVAEKLHYNTIFLAEHKNDPIGYVFGVRSQVNPEEGWIREVAVKKAYEGIGIAKKLQKKCLKAFEKIGGIKYVALTVEEENERAIGLYKSLGFRERTIFTY
jgi:ribosomal protein S18 acetylase RimI-like enzyme